VAGPLAPLRGLLHAIRSQPGAGALLVTMVTLLAIGTVFYSLHENWSVLDSLFFVVTTLVTIGYGNQVPTTDLGKIFTIVYVLLGAAVIVAFFNLVVLGMRGLAEEQIARREPSGK
jgi:hypothetical protein